MFLGKELTKSKAILGHLIERLIEAAAGAAAAGGGAADEFPEPGVQGVGVKSHHGQVC